MLFFYQLYNYFLLIKIFIIIMISIITKEVLIF